MSSEDFRLGLFTLITKDRMKIKRLIDEGYAQRLNVVFDVDHTLVHAISENEV